MRRLLAMMVVVGLGGALALPIQAMADGARITVTGMGEASGVPDLATLTLAVETDAATAAEAVSANSETMSAVTAGLKAAGVADRDLRTTGVAVMPRYRNSDDPGAADDPVAGYQVVNRVEVRVRDLAALGGLIDGAIAKGANRIDGLSLGFADSKPLEDEARKAAVADAIAKAKLYADAAGVKLGDLQRLSDQMRGPGPQPMLMARAAVPVETGEMSVSATVVMSWAIAD
ncbi:SIMPL domain-containing protein [Acuticoccus mangrovi]|uniref:SIMPL domain-containing protein n=1 Tax=Acuticoccus mangrovi TaxID=2796142 RepID=A0A934IMB6_9HYPH|nr:SIMPL domain-containing protein [Acuticoccus mangrovi]MBJ3774998.1 SIMPL domain-containing protein [Acuticoccus mangrovi]